MTRFQVVEAKPYHCGQMARQLRQAHTAALLRYGVSAHHEIKEHFEASAYRRAWLIDGHLAALGGVVGPRICATGHVWLAMTEAATRHPRAALETARTQIRLIMQTKRLLTTTILPGDEASLRFAIFLGFSPDGVAAESRFGRRALRDRVSASPEDMVPVKGGFATPMVYQEAA